MNIQLFREIIGYTQNLGSHEDIVTACLATAFSYCPKFTRKFFLELDINDFPWRHERGHDYGYLVSTGPRINGNFGKLGSGIDFKPDIMISKLEEWEDKSKLKNEHLILIESKLGAVLDEKQEKNYQLFRKRFSKKFPNQIHLILISLKKESFDNFLNKSWYEIIEIIEKIIKDMDDWSSEKLILKEIFDFMRISLIPDKGNFKNDEMDYCPKRILNELKSRTNFSSARLKQYSSISKNPISCPEYQAMKKAL